MEGKEFGNSEKKREKSEYKGLLEKRISRSQITDKR